MSLVLVPLFVSLFFEVAVLHALPILPRRSRLFGVRVPPQVRFGPEGAALLRRYNLWLAPWTVGACAVVWLPGIVGSGWPLVLLFALPLFAAWVLLGHARARAGAFALPAPTMREAALAPPEVLGPRVAWFLPPLLVLAGTAAFLHDHRDRIPPHFPNHWGIDGRPNGWGSATPWGIYGLLGVASLSVLLLAGIAFGVEFWSRRSTQRATWFVVLTATTYLVAVALAVASLAPLYGPALLPVVLFLPGWLIVLVVAMALRSLRRGAMRDDPGDVTPDASWHGVFYYNVDDPALFVEKRFGIGYTLNFAHRGSWIVLGSLALIVVATVLLTRR